MSLRCSACGQEFRDGSGQLAAVLAQARSGALALALGCGRCGVLCFPAVREGAAEAPAPPAGAARYEAGAVLGAGGMGVVRAARDRVRNEAVCIKSLRPRTDPSALRQELEALERLRHPHIVRLLDRYEDDGKLHLVLELVVGPALDRYLAAHGPFGEAAALAVAEPLLEALAYAHAAGVTHRDLKPSNVLLEWREGQVFPRLVDFGVAIVDGVDDRGAQTGKGAPAGTPVYMSPEQLRGELVTERADCYALGVLLAELVLGRAPFAARSVFALMQEKLALPQGVRLSHLAASREFSRFVQGLTRAAPAERFTAAQALEALRALRTPALASAPRAPYNLRFEHAAEAQRPAGWSDGVGLVGSASATYRARALRTGSRGCVELAAPSDAPEAAFGTVVQSTSARGLEGGELTFAALVETRGVTGYAALWARVDNAEGRSLAFDNMAGRGPRGDTPWQPLELTVTVPEGAVWVHYGLLLAGSGVVRARGATLRATRANGLVSALELDPLESPMT